MLELVKIVLIVLKKCDLSSLYQNASSEREILASSWGQADRRAEISRIYIRVRVRVKVELYFNHLYFICKKLTYLI